MTTVVDINDRVRAGQELPDKVPAKPMNEAARKKAEEGPRILTVRQLLEAAEKRAKSAAREGWCTTGHYQLDDATGGIRPGHGWVFGAETNWGKSSWLVAVVDENLKIGKRCLIVTSEDDESIYGNRLLARRSGVTATRIRNGDLDMFDVERVHDCVTRAENMPVFLDARGKTVEWTAREVEQLIDTESIDLVAYDYLQEFSVARQQENHRLTVKYAAGALRKVVKLKKRASIIFSQITIDESLKRAYPTRNMIRDCRDVANAAEVILLGYTPAQAIEAQDGRVLVPSGSHAVWVDKVKDGPKGFAVGLHWDDDTASFQATWRNGIDPGDDDDGRYPGR